MIHVIAVGNYVILHIVGVLLAIVASVVVGFIWHGWLFNKRWAKLAKLDQLSKEQMQTSMVPGLTANVVMAFVQAAVLGRAFQLLALNGILDAFIIALIIWLPFVALTMLNNYIWAQKPQELWMIDAGYNLASLLAIAAVVYVTL